MAIPIKDIWYTAVMPFTPSTDKEAWFNYIEWSKLYHLKEVVGMDSSLNESAFLPDFDDPETYNIGITIDTLFTYCYRNIEYVIKHASAKSQFNLLAVYLNPTEEVSQLPLPEFEFAGYELLDQNHQTSALTNCGGFDETFLPDDLNVFGLIGSYSKATDIQFRLKENNPMEHHADTNVWAIWRHTKLVDNLRIEIAKAKVMRLPNHVENLNHLREKDIEDLAAVLIQSITVKENESTDSLKSKYALIKELITFLEKYLNERILAIPDKLRVVKILDKLNIRKELTELRLNEFSEENLRIVAERLGHKSQSAFDSI